MNERIKELKKQAWEYAMAVHDGHIVPPLDKEVWPLDEVFDEKFAELVWKVAYEEGHDVGVDAGFEAGRNASFTEQNFGVEE